MSLSELRRMPWTLITAVLTGVLLSPILFTVGNSIVDAYDDAFPVVEMKGAFISRLDDAVVISVKGRKLRDCQFLKIDSYSVMPDGVRLDAYESRLNGGRIDKGTKPIGDFDLGHWQIQPINTQAVAVEMYVEHMCRGHITITKIAEVAL